MRATREFDFDIIGDLSNISQADEAVKNGCSMLSTALSGYTEENSSKDNWEPDFSLLSLLVENFKLPVFAEGRYWKLDHVKRAIDIGAHAVVIGSAITRPHLITEYFSSVFR